jgi:multiple sugar transport system ATP-binding protein
LAPSPADEGRDVVLGVRPEHVFLADAPAPVGPSLSATLEAVEPTGPELHLILRCGAHELIARVAPRSLPAPGTPLQLRLAADHLHFFSAEPGGLRIGTAG